MKYIFILLILCLPIKNYAFQLEDADDFIREGLEKNLFLAEEEEQLMSFGTFYYDFFENVELTPLRKKIFLKNSKNFLNCYYKLFSRSFKLSAEDLKLLDKQKHETYFEFCLNKDFKKIHSLNDEDLIAAFKWFRANHIELSREEILIFYRREFKELREELVKNYDFLWNEFEEDLIEQMNEKTVLSFCKSWEKVFDYFQKIDYPQFFYSDVLVRTDLSEEYFEKFLKFILKKEGMTNFEVIFVLDQAINHKYFSEKYAIEILENKIPVQILLKMLGNVKISKETRKKIIAQIKTLNPAFMIAESFSLNFNLEEQKELLKNHIGIQILALANDTNSSILDELSKNIDNTKYMLIQNPNIAEKIKIQLLKREWKQDELEKIIKSDVEKSDLTKEILIKNAKEIDQNLFSKVKNLSAKQQEKLFNEIYEKDLRKWNLLDQNSINIALLAHLKKQFFNALKNENPIFYLRSVPLYKPNRRRFLNEDGFLIFYIPEQ